MFERVDVCGLPVGGQPRVRRSMLVSALRSGQGRVQLKLEQGEGRTRPIMAEKSRTLIRSHYVVQQGGATVVLYAKFE